MPRGRTFLTGFVALCLLAVLGLVYLKIQAQTRGVFRTQYVAAHDLAAGSLVGSGDVKAIRIPEGGDVFNVLSEDPTGRFRLATKLAAGDPLRASDLLPKDAYIEIPLSLKTGLALSSGDKVDVWAQQGGESTLIGRNITLTGASSALVPAQDEGDWVTVNASGIQLLAVRSGGGLRTLPGAGLTPQDSLRHLATIARGGSTSPTP